MILLVISGKWVHAREGGKEDIGFLLDWIVVVYLPWWYAKALLALAA